MVTDCNLVDEMGANDRINLEDLQVFQQILHQNQQILQIQSQLMIDNRETKEFESLSNTLNLFLENQKML